MKVDSYSTKESVHEYLLYTTKMDNAKLDQILALMTKTANDVKTTADDVKEIKQKLGQLEKGESLLRIENKKLKLS